MGTADNQAASPALWALEEVAIARHVEEFTRAFFRRGAIRTDDDKWSFAEAALEIVLFWALWWNSAGGAQVTGALPVS